MSKFSELNVFKIKKNFPDAGALLSRIVSSVATAYSSTAAQVHTDSTGIKELIVSPIATATVGSGINIAFAAPSDAVAAAWFADTTADSDTLQYVFVPGGTTRSFIFNSAIIRWDYQAVGAATTIRQEIVR